MIDFTPHLIKRHSDELEREHQAQQLFEERKQSFTSEMLVNMLEGGSVMHLNADGQQVETSAEDCLAGADPAEVLALLREAEKTPGAPPALRLKICGLFAKLASEFGEYAAENAR